MTAPAFTTFTPPTPTADGARFSPRDNIGHALVIKVNEHKFGIVTANAPQGTEAVSVDLVDLDTQPEPTVYRDALMFGGALVDGLSPYVGQIVVIKLEARKSTTGRTYPAPLAGNSDDLARAKAYFAVNPAAFAPEVNAWSDPGRANGAVTQGQPPF